MNDKKEMIKLDERKNNSNSNRRHHSFRHTLGKILSDTVIFNQEW